MLSIFFKTSSYNKRKRKKVKGKTTMQTFNVRRQHHLGIFSRVVSHALRFLLVIINHRLCCNIGWLLLFYKSITTPRDCTCLRMYTHEMSSIVAAQDEKLLGVTSVNVYLQSFQLTSQIGWHLIPKVKRCFAPRFLYNQRVIIANFLSLKLQQVS